MAIPNSDEMRDPFPGIGWGGPSAPGTQGARGGQADSAGATVTPPAGTWQDRYPAAAGTVQPDQSGTTPISPGPRDDYVSTGAGRGNPEPYRHPNGDEGWQLTRAPAPGAAHGSRAR